MIRIVGVGDGGPESCPTESIEALKSCSARFHAAPWHTSFRWLADMGLACEPMPLSGVSGTAVVAVPLLLALPEGRIVERQTRAEALEALVQVVDRLLGPGGCPWDREQTHETLKKYLLEETYEVLDAIDSGSAEKLKEELGDLLLQPIMHAQMERAAGSYDIGDVAKTITEKLIRRHPHVFGQLSVEDADEVLRNWDRIKQEEKGDGRGPGAAGETEASAPSILEGVPKALPALHRAFEVSKRAARVGFEWPTIEAVFRKLEEEDAELREAIRQAAGSDSAEARRRVEDEIGDMLFTVVNLARWCKVEPEEALRRMVGRFTGRFQRMESLAEKPLRELSAEEWDALWERAKTEMMA